jgi:hypothetical protein
MRWKEHKARMEKTRNVYWMLSGETEGKIAHGRSGRRWDDNIK